MKISSFQRHLALLTLLAGASCLWTGGPALAGVITDPVLFTGPDAIDPTTGANAGDLNATGLVGGAATKAALTSTPGFGVIQDFIGFDNASGAKVNFITFNDPAQPDIRVTTTSYNGSGGGSSNNFTTSGLVLSGGNKGIGDSNQFIGSGGYAPNAASIIEFGTYDPTSGEFVADRAVCATGFMISQNAAAVARTWTAEFKDSAANVLSTQTIDAGANSAFLFGHIEGTDKIASIALGITGGGDAGTFMDDLGFAVCIPEPSSGLLGLMLLLPLGARRRG